MIADDLTDHIVPIDTLVPMERNPRRGDVDAIAASLDRFGQVKPVVVSTDNRIIAGNHTHAAAVRLGWDQIAAVRVDLHSTDAQALALAVADNRTGDLSRWDNDQLMEFLTEIQTADADLLESTGFTAKQLDDLASTAAPPAFPTDDGDIPSEGDNSATSGLHCPNCGYAL